MDFTPDEAGRKRVAVYVRAEMGNKDPFRMWQSTLDQLPDGVMDGLLNGTAWPAPLFRKQIEGAFFWREGDLEWVARGGEPTRLGAKGNRRLWKVRVTVEREIEAPTSADAIASVTEPVKSAFDEQDGVSIVECSAVNRAAALDQERANRVRQP